MAPVVASRAVISAETAVGLIARARGGDDAAFEALRRMAPDGDGLWSAAFEGCDERARRAVAGAIGRDRVERFAVASQMRSRASLLAGLDPSPAMTAAAAYASLAEAEATHATACVAGSVGRGEAPSRPLLRWAESASRRHADSLRLVAQLQRLASSGARVRVAQTITVDVDGAHGRRPVPSGAPARLLLPPG